MVSVQVFTDAYHDQSECKPALNGTPTRKIQALRDQLFKSNIMNKAEQVIHLKGNTTLPLRFASSAPNIRSTESQIDGQMKTQLIHQIARQQRGIEELDGTFPQVCCF